MGRVGHGVALLSGGLDSALAVKLCLEQGLRITAVRFMTHFGCDAGGGGSCGHDVTGLARELGIPIKLCPLGEEYIERVRNPKFGRGANMNICIDCRVMMLAWAGEYRLAVGADFVLTGEVLNQRPMSQTRERFGLIDRECGLEGRVLRPLSARLLAPTIPEIEGLVDRSRLLGLHGRSRKPQLELAARWGITDYGQPAGGCLLTDPGYSHRLRELWDHDPAAGASDIMLLQVGRHFRLGPSVKAIVGRDEGENVTIEAYAEPGDALLGLADYVGPTTLVRGPCTEPELARAAALTVRYGDAPEGAEVTVTLRLRGAPARTLRSRSIDPAEADRMRVAR
jgi:hypothetical protein